MRGNMWLSKTVEPTLVSVIVPTFNRAHTIIETLDSVKQQNYRPIEILIQDDGSTDGTEQAVKKWIGENKEDKLAIRYQKQHNGGVCNARNNALIHSRGQYIQFLDSDDLLLPNRFEVVVDLFNQTGADYVETGCGGFVVEHGENKIIQQLWGHPSRNQLQLLLEGRLWPNTLRPVYKRSLINRVGKWNESMETFQDLEYVSRALTLDGVIAESLKEISCLARREGERMSDIFLTERGRYLRILCEKTIFDGVKNRVEKVPIEWLTKYKSRIYGLAFRTKASGWFDLAKDCFELAESVNAPLDKKGKRRRFIYKTGWLGSNLFLLVARFKNLWL